MKKLKLILCGLLLSVALVGCGTSSISSEPVRNYKYIGGREYLVIENGGVLVDNSNTVFVDTTTKVQYVQFYNGHYSWGSVIVDADGKPILYDGEV